MVFYCTYCSAEKKYSDSSTPAIELYKSERIRNVYTKSKDDGAGFVILSGKYGLVEAQHPPLAQVFRRAIREEPNAISL
jgi:hypothetical protein